MDHRKPLIGLKMTFSISKVSLSGEEEDSDVFFDSDDDDNSPLSFSSKPSSPQKPIIPPPPPMKAENKITSFDDALPKITVILSSLDDYKENLAEKGEIYFVPEHIASDELSSALNTFANSQDPNVTFEKIADFKAEESHENILAQIDIVRFYKNQKIDFTKYNIKNLDSRISALIYFFLAKNDDRKASLFYYIKSLSEYLKNHSNAPVSSLFPEFTLKNIIHGLCCDLTNLFPHNPLLPSVIHKFSSFDPSAPNLLDLIGEDDEESDSDFSDSFFDEIQTIHQRQAPLINPTLVLQSSAPLSNVLDNTQGFQTTNVTITVNEPPSTFTYYLADDSSQLNPNSFIDWIHSFVPSNSQSRINFFNSASMKLTKSDIPNQSDEIHPEMSLVVDNYLGSLEGTDAEYEYSEKSNPVNRKKRVSLPSFDQISDSNEHSTGSSFDSVLNLYLSDSSLKELISKIPNYEDNPELFHIQLPLLRRANSLSVSPFTRKCPYPKLLEFEFNGSAALEGSNANKLKEIVDEIFNLVDIEHQNKTQVQRLPKKRKLPNINTPSPDNTIDLIYLCDAEFLLNGRSPITLSRCGRQTNIPVQYDNKTRAEVLFSMYTSHSYPPFITFLASFALALNLSEFRPSLATDIIFEGIYTLFYNIPQITRWECARNALLFLAELLEKNDCYFYSSILFDSIYLLNPQDVQLSNNIATICHRNHDMVRAVFHYTRSLENFVKKNCVDEALYISQILSQIFSEYKLNKLAINFLSRLLQSSYSLPFGKVPSKQQIANAHGSVKSVTKKTKLKEFKPPPESVNTLLSGITLCDNLIKLRHFSIASQLLTTMKNNTDNIMFQKIFDYLHVRLLLKNNQFDEFMYTIKDIQVKLKPTSSGSRLSLFSASNFDSSLAKIRLIINGCLTRRLFAVALFWSEVYINAQAKFAVKDIGVGFLQRGVSLFQARYQLHAASPPFSLHVLKLSEVMSNAANYAQNRLYNNIDEVLTEALSSLKSAQICLEKVGCARLLTHASLFYADLLLHYFCDNTFMGEEDPNTVQIEPIVINEPQLEIENNSTPSMKLVTFPPLTLDSSSVIDELTSLFRRIDQNVNRDMNPIYIIYSQVLKSKLNFLQHKEATAKTLFDYAYSNINKYFVCGGTFVAKDMGLKEFDLFNNILNNMCLLLLFFEKDYINDHLIVFDWRNDIQSLHLNRLRVVPDENKDPIQADFSVSDEYLRSLRSPKFPNFFKIQDKYGNKLGGIDSDNQGSNLTISKCLSIINANIHLFEAEKIAEDEMHDNNRALCRQIESEVDKYKRSHETQIPIDTSYDYVYKTVPMFRNAIFVQHIYDCIYIYVPSTGKKRRVLLKPGQKSTFNVLTKKECITYTSTSGLIASDLMADIALFLMCDKKQHHTDYNFSKAYKRCVTAKKTLFGDLNDIFYNWDKVPDDHLFGESKIFGKGLKGALASIETSPQPTIFVTSGDLRALPFEMMFPNILVLRSWSYSHIILKPTEELEFPKVSVCRWKGDAEHLMQNAVQRSREIIRCFVEACGGCFPMQPYVNGNDRNVCFPFPLFSSNLENNHYISKYPFCNFIDVEPNKFPKISSALFVFTYSDLSEMPLMLESLVSEYPFSFYMFIPAQFVREAFTIMSSIFERHHRRAQYLKDHPNDPSLSRHQLLCKVPFDFVTCLQATLMQQLNCPIALIAPTH